MFKFNGVLLISFCLIVLTTCSSSNDFRNNSWGTTIEKVEAKESKNGNHDFTKNKDDFGKKGDYYLLYKNIMVSNQKADLMMDFSHTFNGKNYNDLVLVDGSYVFDKDNFDEKVVFDQLNAKYGKSEKKHDEKNYLYYEWTSGETVIWYYPAVGVDDPTVIYTPKSEVPNNMKTDNQKNNAPGL